MRVTSHLTLDGVMQSNGKPEPELNDGFEQGGWQVPYFGQGIQPGRTRVAGVGDLRPVLREQLVGPAPRQESVGCGDGVVAHTYQPSGKPQYGAAAAEQEGDVVMDSVRQQIAT